MVQELVVEAEVIAGNDVDTGIPLDLPVRKSESLAFCKKLLLRQFTAPVSLGGLLELTVGPHAGKPENGSVWETLDRDQSGRAIGAYD
jgi:hypothetical protein